MDPVRHFLALLIVISFPAVLPVWILIHSFAAFWRRRGPVVTYGVALTVAFAIGFVLFRVRDSIVSGDYGFSAVSAAAGVALYSMSVAIEIQCWRHLSLTTLVGLPEVSRNHASTLLSDGIYARVRHPRYLSVMIGVFAFAFFVNYLSVYVVAVGTVPLLFLVVILEERELIARFGDEYRRYMEQVPRFIPRVLPRS